MRNLIESITAALVDDKDNIDIKITEGVETMVVEVTVSPEDIGKVIGKKGVTADAFRTILTCAGAKMGKRAILQILDHKHRKD